MKKDSQTKTTAIDANTLLATVPLKNKTKKCTAQKGDYPCTILGCHWCNECVLYK